MDFKDTYLGKLRRKIGNEVVLVPVFRMVIEDSQERILLVKRADDGTWALPAGLPEKNESIRDLIEREVKEETGLEVKDYQVYGYSSRPPLEIHTYPHGDQIHCFALLVCTKNYRGTARVNDNESTEVRFFHARELPSRENMNPNEAASLHAFFEYKKTGAFQWV